MGILISVGVKRASKIFTIVESSEFGDVRDFVMVQVCSIPGSGRFAAAFGLCAADLVGPTLERANKKYERAEALETEKKGQPARWFLRDSKHVSIIGRHLFPDYAIGNIP